MGNSDGQFIILGFHYIEWLAFICSLLYTLLAAKNRIICWLFGFLGSAFTLLLCINASLFSESLLQVFYILMAVYGWWSWRQRTAQGSIALRPIKRMKKSHHVGILLGGAILSLGMGFFWNQFGAAIPYVDATTTIFSIIATWLIAQRYLENWLYWVVIDAVSIYIYFDRDLVLLAILFSIYTALALYGFSLWKKEWQTQSLIS